MSFYHLFSENKVLDQYLQHPYSPLSLITQVTWGQLVFITRKNLKLRVEENAIELLTLTVQNKQSMLHCFAKVNNNTSLKSCSQDREEWVHYPKIAERICVLLRGAWHSHIYTCTVQTQHGILYQKRLLHIINIDFSLKW